jgi:hypothetical protein
MVDGEKLVDTEGLVLSDLESAHAVALKSAREIIAEQVKEGEVSLADRIEIVDESGTVVGTVGFRDAVTITG